MLKSTVSMCKQKWFKNHWQAVTGSMVSRMASPLFSKLYFKPLKKGGAQSSSALSKTFSTPSGLGGPNAPISAWSKHGFVEIFANQGVASVDLNRILTFQIGFSDVREGTLMMIVIMRMRMRMRRMRMMRNDSGWSRPLPYHTISLMPPPYHSSPCLQDNLPHWGYKVEFRGLRRLSERRKNTRVQSYLSSYHTCGDL